MANRAEVVAPEERPSVDRTVDLEAARTIDVDEMMERRKHAEDVAVLAGPEDLDERGVEFVRRTTVPPVVDDMDTTETTIDVDEAMEAMERLKDAEDEAVLFDKEVSNMDNTENTNSSSESGAYAFDHGRFMTASELNAEQSDDFDWDTYWREQLYSRLVTANPVQDEETALPRAEPDDGPQHPEPGHSRMDPLCIGLCGIGGFLVLGAIILSVVLSVVTPIVDDTLIDGPNSTKLGKKEVMMHLLPDYTLAALDWNYTKTDPIHWSPQTKAFNWTINDPGFDSYKDWKLRQRFALACFFFATGGDTTWDWKDSWLSYEIDELAWQRKTMFHADVVDNWLPVLPMDPFQQIIDTEESPEFSHLWVANNGLVGSLPPELYMLTSLRSLDLTGNPGLSGTISSEIGLMQRLQGLSVYSCQISGTIPTELGRLQSMVALKLAENRLHGPLPSEIGKMSDLFLLEISDNNLSGEIPSELGLISSTPLILWAKNNNFQSTIPTELGMLKKSFFLSFKNNSLYGTIPSELGNIAHYDLGMKETLPKLLNNVIPGFSNWLREKHLNDILQAILERADTGLFLDWNNLTGTIPSELGRMRDADSLKLSHNRLTGSIPSEIALLTDLSYLLLDHNELTGPVPSEIGLMTALSFLSLQNNALEEPIPDQLGSLTELHPGYWFTTKTDTLTGTAWSNICAAYLHFNCSVEACECR